MREHTAEDYLANTPRLGCTIVENMRQDHNHYQDRTQYPGRRSQDHNPSVPLPLLQMPEKVACERLSEAYHKRLLARCSLSHYQP